MASDAPTTVKVSDPYIQFCAVCKKDETKLSACGKCLSIFYCSQDCQKADWSLHRMLCDAFANATRPDDDEGKPCKRCVFFDAAKRAPEIFWVPARGNTEPMLSRVFSSEDREQYLRGEIDPVDMSRVIRVPQHMPKSEQVVTMFSNMKATIGNLAVTAAARRLDEAMWGTYPGSAFLVRQTHGDNPRFEDVHPADFRAAVQTLSRKMTPDLVALERQLGRRAFDQIVSKYGEEA